MVFATARAIIDRWITRPRLAVIVFSIFAVSGSWCAPPAQQEKADEVHQLWSAVVDPNIKRQMKANDQEQMIGMTMMVPLHAAFHRRDEEWIHNFAAQFALFASDPSALPSGDVAELSRLYYMYLASQFVVLAKKSGRQDLIPPNLPDLLFSEVHTYWYVTPAPQFDGPHFPGGARQRLLWKLKNHKVKKSYYRVVLDHDLYAFAIAADLKAFGGNADQQKAWNPTLDDMLSIARQVFTQEVVRQPDGGWVFQPGVWTDHPEFQYAGNPEAHPGIKPAPVREIAPDTGHSVRFPLWLTSLMQAYPPDSEEHRFYETLRTGLEKQFFSKVLFQPTEQRPCYLLTNFMDGSNGVYRWSYESLGKGNGYGPYQNSGSLLLGWWIFLDTERIRNVYRELAKQFPWPRQCLDYYLGPHPADAPRPESAYDPNSSVLHTFHLTTQLAAGL